jgi:hypothetical protein|tara:strand:+ start:3016 stop:4059 length:1044 start_codon:yes stop_codon:yes gene_type:complete
MTLSITKPVVGGSLNSWGTVLNTALDAVVTEINTNAATVNATTVTGTTVNATNFNIGGVAVSADAGELNKLNGATVTVNEINILDGDTAATSTSVAATDRVVFNDAGVMKQVAMSDIASYIGTVSSAGTVTSVGMTVPNGLSVSTSSITTSGTFAISLASGYAIPTTTSQSQWNTAYNWGDHSNGGYLTSVAVSGSELGVSTSGSTVTITHTPTAPTTAEISSAMTSTIVTNNLTDAAVTAHLTETAVTANLPSYLAQSSLAPITASLNAVGSYAWLGSSTATTFTAGTSYNASGLKFAGFLSTNAFNDDTAAAITGATPSGGTWRAMGTASHVSNRAPSTLFIRVT